MSDNKLAMLQLKVEKAREKASQANEKLERTQKALREYRRVTENSISVLGLTPRLMHTLKRANVETVEELLQLLNIHGTGIYAIRNFGAKSMNEVIESLIRCGFSDEETLEKIIHPPHITYQEWVNSVGGEQNG
jgi:DNA-directed RNA polymerase alpha subunit